MIDRLIDRVVDWLDRRSTPDLTKNAPGEALVEGENALLCVCDEEWCYCTALVPMPLGELQALARLGVGVTLGNNPCPACVAGHHVWAPDGPRT